MMELLNGGKGDILHTEGFSFIVSRINGKINIRTMFEGHEIDLSKYNLTPASADALGNLLREIANVDKD